MPPYLKFLSLVVCLIGSTLQSKAQVPPEVVPFEVELTGSPGPGYFFIGPRSLNPNDAYPTSLMLLDSLGELIWYAPIAEDSTAPYFNFVVYDFKPLGDGLLSFWRPKFTGDKFFLLDSTFSIVDSVSCLGRPRTDEHDIVRMDNGHHLVICADDTIADLSGLNTTTGATGSIAGLVAVQAIQEVDLNGNVAYEWRTMDHLPIEDSDTAFFNNPNYLDHTHLNSLFLRGDEVVISSRNLNEITSFSRSSGEINWRFGGKGNEFLIVGDSLPFRAQHDANFDAAGNLYFFDNGSTGEGSVARYVEYNLDTVSKVASLVREHRHPKGYRSLFMGNAVKLENDNVVVAWGGTFPQDSTAELTEFEPDGSIALDLNFEDEYLTYRVHKEALPFELERPPVLCDDVDHLLIAPGGYASYWWNTGATSSSITVTDTGTYQVWVNQGIGFIGSVKVRVTDVSDLCGAVARVEEVGESLRMWPMPVKDRLEIEVPTALRGGWKLELWDAMGRSLMVKTGRGSEAFLEMEKWPMGVYGLRMTGEKGLSYRGKVIKTRN